MCHPAFTHPINTLRQVPAFVCRIVIAAVMLAGCSAPSEGSSAAARKYLEDALEQWKTTGTSDASARYPRKLIGSFEIVNFRKGDPTKLSYMHEQDTSEDDFNKYPTYRSAVYLHFKIEDGGTSLKPTQVSYALTWSTKKQQWYIEPDR